MLPILMTLEVFQLDRPSMVVREEQLLNIQFMSTTLEVFSFLKSHAVMLLQRKNQLSIK